jgi:nucleoid-associated protein YgaU
MGINAKKCSVGASALLAAFIFGCGDPIPLKEMSTARLEISKAVTVKAEKYAPAQLKEASDLLFKSHDSVKDEKYDDAKKNADAAYAKAQEAYIVAVPLLAKDAIGVAEKSVMDADAVYAAELANADFAAANEKLAKAKTQNDAKDFYTAYKTALEADNQAKTARNLALSKKGTLKDAIADVKETISRAEKLGARNSASGKLSSAKADLAKAESANNSMMLKDGFNSIQAAKTNADGAYLEALKAYSAANIEKVALMIGELEQSKGSSAVKDEISGAKELLSTSKNLHDSGKYNESIKSSDEAARIIVAARSVADKAIADEDAAAALAAEAASRSKAEAAAKVKSSSKSVVDADASSEYDIYVVQYFKDRARDCLWFVAQRFYNKPALWKKIFDANRDKIRDPNLIRPGWKLKVPKLEPVKKAEPAKTVSPEMQDAAVPAKESAPAEVPAGK